MKRIFEDIIDDAGMLDAHSRESVSSQERLKPEDDSEHRFHVKIDLPNNFDLWLYMDIRYSIETAVSAFPVDASDVILSVKTNYVIEEGRKKGVLKPEEEHLITVNPDDYANVSFAFNSDNLTVFDIKRLYKSIYQLRRKSLVLGILTVDKQTGKEVDIRSYDDLEEDCKIGLICQMVWAPRYDGSLDIYRKILKFSDEYIIKDLADGQDEYIGNTKEERDCSRFVEVRYKTAGKYQTNCAFNLIFRPFDGVDDMVPPTEMNFDSVTVEGKKLVIREGMKYAFIFNDSTWNRCSNVTVYLGMGYFNNPMRRPKKTVVTPMPGFVFIECALYINEETTWDNYHEWFDYLRMMLGDEIIDDELTEQIQDTFKTYNVDFKDV